MQLSGPTQQPLCDEMKILAGSFDWSGTTVLELGCGRAERTRAIQAAFQPQRIIAAEVDASAHADNLARTDVGIEYREFGAQAIDAADDSIDLVLMFKSLHHVPGELLDCALTEIRRVLRPGGKLYVSEPVFAGDLNEVIRLFHDEELVRQAAFDALLRACDGQQFRLHEERFFRTSVNFKSFAQFKAGIVDATFAEHQLSDQLLAEVEQKFHALADASRGGFYFESPMRVDILQPA